MAQNHDHGHDHGHAHDDHGHDAHDAHGHEAFDPEPTNVVPDDEPTTPRWAPPVGAALLSLGVLWALVGGEPSSSASGAASAKAGAAQAGANPSPNPNTPQRLVEGATPRPVAAPPGSGSGSVRRLTPEQVRDVQQKMQEVQRARAAQGGSAAPGAPPAPAAPAAPGGGTR